MNDALMKTGGTSYLVLPVGTLDHDQGPTEATVTLLEYGDFECPRCAEAYFLVNEIKRWLRGELRYVFRHFPDVEKHPHALKAAEAAEAAGAQGKFWEMHGLLCERCTAHGDIYLNCYAQELGLDLERFEREMREHTHLGKARKDFESGIASGVTETPTFFINGVRYIGTTDLDSLLAAIEEAGILAIGSDR
jgi:protein-disulfide isomerase